MTRNCAVIGGLLLAAWAARASAQVGGVTLGGGGGGTATSINVQTLSTGTFLYVNPAVSPDLRYVGMAITPQFSALDGVDTFILGNPSSPAAAGGIASNGTLQAVAIRRVPFRPSQVGKVAIVDNDKPLLAALVKAAQWKAISFKDAVRKLADTTRENMVLGIRGLDQAGVDVNVKADYNIPNGTVKDVLLAILQVGAPETDMVVNSEEKVVTISTQAQADQVLITKTYYLEDLLARIPRFVAAGTDLNQLGAGQLSGLDAAAADKRHSMDLSKPPADPAPAATKPKPATAPHSGSTNILEVITDTVRPEIWVNHGGKSEAYVVGNQVTIKAPASVHALLDGPKVYNPNKISSYVNYAP